MTIRPIVAKDDGGACRHSIMAYGYTGAGKTTWAARSPRPLFLLTEPQAATVIRLTNPDAEYIVINSWADFLSAWEAIITGEVTTTDDKQRALRVRWDDGESIVQTIVIDSLSDLQNIQFADIKGLSGVEALSLQRPTLTLNEWGSVQDAMLTLLRQQRTLPINVIVLALAADRYEEIGSGAEIRRVIPSFRGKMISPNIGQTMTAVGYLTQDKHKRRIINWRFDPRFCSKPGPGNWPDLTLQDVTIGDMAMATLGANAMHTATDSGDNCVDCRQIQVEEE